MTAMRGPRLQVGSAAWIGEERSSSLQIVEQEVEEFSYSARNELEWINEHMAGILNENEINLAEAFKSPAKFRSKTPQTTRKQNAPESRMPLSDVFAATSNGPKSPSPFIQPQPQSHSSTNAGRFKSPQLHSLSKPTPLGIKPTSPRRVPIFSPKKGESSSHPMQDSGFYGSQDFNIVGGYGDSELDKPQAKLDHPLLPPSSPLRLSPLKKLARESPEKIFPSSREGQAFNFTLGSAAKEWPKQDDTEKEEEEEESDEDAGDGNEPEDYVESFTPEHSPTPAGPVDEDLDDARSSSEASSPLRPLGRKSSLNFASLPAREPLTGGKSLGGNNRSSFFQRATGGKSLGNLMKQDPAHREDDDMDVDDEQAGEETETERQPLNHAKTYTQRLQDQISMLGKPASSSGQVKVVTTAPMTLHAATAPQPSTTPDSSQKVPVPTTPGAGSQDDDDDWIDPPKIVEETQTLAPSLSKSFTADIMEGVHSKDTLGQTDLSDAKNHYEDAHVSPQKLPAGGKGFQSLLGHGKTASIATMSTSSLFGGESLILARTGSNSELTLTETNVSDTPSKSPSRTLRDSPLKQVKNKLSSILKSSRGLLASSAAISAEGKSLMSPSSSRLALHLAPSSESIVAKPDPPLPSSDSQSVEAVPASPTKPIARRTRASTEREKEEKRREREAKVMAEQMDKLDKAREEERERARIFNKEQESIATMEKQVASQNQQQDRPTAKETSNLVISSPGKIKATGESDFSKQTDTDVDMTDKEPGALTRPARPSQLMRPKETKRPIKPTKEIAGKMKQAPTVIRVNTGSQTSQYHPAGNRVSTAAHDTTGTAASQSSARPGKPTLQSKSSSQNLKSFTAAGRPKALEMSVRKKEQEEKEAQRRRDAKAEMDKKRAAAQEEQRKQAEKQRHGDAEEKKLVSRQVAIEKAKQSRAPPPALRSQPFGPSDATMAQQKGEPSRPPSRMTSGVPVSSTLASAVKAGAKRALIPDSGDEGPSKRPPSRGGPSYQIKDAKRRRTSEVFDEADTGHPRNIKGPPVRPSGGFKKDLPTKSVFQSGYANAPHSATRDLFKATVTAQHNSHIKASHPLDMAQISKGPIPFAPTHNGAGSSFKTPARPGTFAGAKSTVKKSTRSSPRFQNGDSIELPEIETDDEDEDDDAPSGMVAAWADSPDLRKALIRQETLDPSQIFGPPAPLNMEEVFNKSKDKWHKFRQRTSSANWSGLDRLTEDDIRKDMAARDKLRRDGGWSYEMSKNL